MPKRYNLEGLTARQVTDIWRGLVWVRRTPTLTGKVEALIQEIERDRMAAVETELRRSYT